MTTARRKRRLWLSLILLTILISAVPISCVQLQRTERELVFRVQPGTASWFKGKPAGIREEYLRFPDFPADQSIHAWWWPARKENAPAILYLHGARWNLTGQLFRIEQLHAMGYSVLAIDYRGFGNSRGEYPSEKTVYQDARIAWQRLTEYQPNPSKRLIYGHSLGGAIAIDLAAELERTAQPQVAGLIVESTFTNLKEAAQVISRQRLPVHWLLSQKFDSLDKIRHIHLPILIVHGTRDQYVPMQFSQQLFAAANEPKRLLLIEGGNHITSMRVGNRQYRHTIETSFFH